MKVHLTKIFLLLIMLLPLFFNTGCWDLREINDSAIPASIGIDLNTNKKINFTTQLIQPTPPGESGSSQIENVVITSSDYSVTLAARRAMLSLSRVPEWSHVQSMVLGENLVRKNLPLVIDFMYRTRNIAPDTTLFIALQNHPEELLAQVSSTRTDLKQLIMINEFQLGEYVPITIGYFTYILMTPGIEAAVPQLIIEEIPTIKAVEASGDKNPKSTDNKTKRIVLHGTAVFKGHKMLGSLNETESRGYRWLNSRNKTGGFLVVQSPLNPQNDVALEVTQFSSKTRPQLSSNTIKMHIEINAQLNFYEETGNCDLLTPAMLEKLEQAANLEIVRQINSCIHKSQNLNSDFLGWGLILQEYQPDTWKRLKADWNDVYPVTEYDIKVKTTINHSYLSRKSFQIK